jgi:hypothetical protein
LNKMAGSDRCLDLDIDQIYQIKNDIIITKLTNIHEKQYFKQDFVAC